MSAAAALLLFFPVVAADSYMFNELLRKHESNTALLQDIGTLKMNVKELITTLKEVEDTSQRNFSLVQESLENLNAVVNKDIKQKVEEFSEHISTMRAAKDEIDAILSQVQHDVHRIVPNTFNKEALIMAITIVVVVVFILGLCLYRVNQKVEEMKKFP